ncbi:hypothetical protein R80B4_00169 [Fibrobacteres bacterium R8-0-B4]
MGTAVADRILLEDVTGPEQLAEYYGQEGLADDGGKIAHLIEKTGLMATRSSSRIEDGDMLALLEESVYFGHWRNFK